MRVRFTPAARLDVHEKRAWWKNHREKSPRLFTDELTAVVRKLRDGEDEERQRYDVRNGRVTWRILMPRTRHHVYYRRDDATNEIEILLIASAVAGKPPSV